MISQLNKNVAVEWSPLDGWDMGRTPPTTPTGYSAGSALNIRLRIPRIRLWRYWVAWFWRHYRTYGGPVWIKWTEERFTIPWYIVTSVREFLIGLALIFNYFSISTSLTNKVRGLKFEKWWLGLRGVTLMSQLHSPVFPGLWVF